jgi:hypothetical protein
MKLTEIDIKESFINNFDKEYFTIIEASRLTFKDIDKEFECKLTYLPKEIIIEFENLVKKMEDFINSKILSKK